MAFRSQTASISAPTWKSSLTKVFFSGYSFYSLPGFSNEVKDILRMRWHSPAVSRNFPENHSFHVINIYRGRISWANYLIPFWGWLFLLYDKDHVGLIRDVQIARVDAVLNMALALGLSMDFLCSPQTWSPPTRKQDSPQVRWFSLGEVQKMIFIGRSVLLSLWFSSCCSSFLNMSSIMA